MKIGFVGSKSIEFAYYLARLLTINGQSVSINDMTGKNKVKRYLGCSDSEKALYDVGLSDETAQIVIDYYEDDFPDTSVGMDRVYMCLIQDVADAALLQKFTVIAPTEAFLLIKDCVPVKYDNKYLQGVADKHLEKDHRYIFDYNADDISIRGGLAVSGKINLTKLSDGLRAFLFDSLLSIKPDTDRKKLQKQLKYKR